LVFVAKYRHPVFTAIHLDRMEAIMRAVCEDFGCELVEFNGETEHVHLLVNFPPTVALSRLVNSLASRPGGCGRSSPTWPGTTGGPGGCGQGRTSPARSEVLH
jgi:REP element-mobilizing transposase RayT